MEKPPLKTIQIHKITKKSSNDFHANSTGTLKSCLTFWLHEKITEYKIFKTHVNGLLCSLTVRKYMYMYSLVSQEMHALFMISIYAVS